MHSVVARCRGPYGDYVDRIRDTYLGLDIDKVDCYHPFEAEFESKWLGDICLTYSHTLNATGGISWVRGKERIEKDADHFMVLMMMREGAVSHTQFGTTTSLSAGGMILIDSRQAYRVQRIGSAASFNVRIPLDLLKAALPAPERYCGAAIDARSGTNAVMSEMLMSIWRHADGSMTPDVPKMVERMLDAVSTICASIKTHRHALNAPRIEHFNRAVRFIDSHLSTDRLQPSQIASALKISTGHLHAVMRSHGTSIGRLVMDRRLDRSRRDLLDSGLRSHTISQIAMDWGFSDYAHFSKAFKRRFGVSPKALRATNHDA